MQGSQLGGVPQAWKVGLQNVTTPALVNIYRWRDRCYGRQDKELPRTQIRAA